jgi:hypothetical protein
MYLFPQHTIKTLKKTGNNNPTTSHLSVKRLGETLVGSRAQS